MPGGEQPVDDQAAAGLDRHWQLRRIVVLGQPPQRRRQALLGVGDLPLVDQAAVVIHHRHVMRAVAPVPPDEHPRPPRRLQDTARSRAPAGSSLLLALNRGDSLTPV
jgi:hypothetical protein